MSDLVERLRALAEKATPGVHEARYVPGGMPTTCCDFGVISHATGRETARVWSRQDVEFYAAANPQTILALIARITELERALNIVMGGAEAAEVRITELEGERDTATRALRYFMEDTRFQVGVGGNPIVVDRMLAEVRAILAALSKTEKKGDN